MARTGYATFDATVDKTNQILHAIEDANGWPHDRRQQSYAALRAVLHALRDRLTVNESADLAAQLPMLLRGLYFEGWKPSKVPVKMTKAEFLERIRREFGYDFDGPPQRLVDSVLSSVKRYVTTGEWEDVRASLPKELADVVP